MTGTLVAHDGLHFRCRVEGLEGAPWMVFSNSLMTDLAVWDHQVAAFAPRYRILRYDQRGHGGTAVPTRPATIEQLADDAAALMAHVGARDAVFVGVSMGAATGFCLAARADGLVRRLVAADGNAATPAGGAQAWRDRIEAARRDGMAAFAEATLARWFAPGSRAAASPAIAAVRAMILATPFDGFVACATALQDYDFRPVLGKIRAPTLLIAGAEDGVVPQAMRALQPQIAGARFIELANAGHLPCIEQPGAFNAAVEAFLAAP